MTMRAVWNYRKSFSHLPPFPPQFAVLVPFATWNQPLPPFSLFVPPSGPIHIYSYVNPSCHSIFIRTPVLPFCEQRRCRWPLQGRKEDRRRFFRRRLWRCVSCPYICWVVHARQFSLDHASILPSLAIDLCRFYTLLISSIGIKMTTSQPVAVKYVCSTKYQFPLFLLTSLCLGTSEIWRPSTTWWISVV